MAEFSVPFTLITPAGNLTFNGTGDGLYLTDVQGLDGADLRKPVDPLPQTDGSLVHRGFRSGKTVTLSGYIRADAGTTTRRTSEDTLRGYLDRLIRPTAAELVSSCRLKFTPSGYSDDRMLDAVELVAPVQVSGNWIKTFQFTLSSPYPYTEDLTQIATVIAAGASGTVTNAGNTPSFPTIQVNATAAGVANGSLFTTATVANTTTGLSIVFTAGTAASHYAEVNTLKKTVFTDGNGANLLGNINFTSSTFFQILPGANTVTATSAPIVVLSNNAWA